MEPKNPKMLGAEASDRIFSAVAMTGIIAAMILVLYYASKF